jgi:putative MFS transporter
MENVITYRRWLTSPPLPVALPAMPNRWPALRVPLLSARPHAGISEKGPDPGIGLATFAGLWVGALLLGQIADRMGRRSIFVWALVWYMLCSAIMAFQTTGFSLVIWRFIAGIGLGIELVTIDACIAEPIPRRERGRAFSTNQFITYMAVPLVAFLAWRLVPLQPLGLDGWRWVVLIGSVGAVIVFLLQMGIPES